MKSNQEGFLLRGKPGRCLWFLDHTISGLLAIVYLPFVLLLSSLAFLSQFAWIIGFCLDLAAVHRGISYAEAMIVEGAL